MQNAFGISYEQALNEIWTCSFSMPFTDQKVKEISAFDIIELYDNEKFIGHFRIMPTETRRSNNKKTITYECEHVLSTLLDDVLFSYHQLSNYETVDVLQYILSQQETKRWRLGSCEFTRYFHYSWEHENLLSALFSVPKPFDEQYIWTWDTMVFPWVLNLEVASNEVTGEVRYRKNLKGITKIEDPTGVITRIYPLGYGEGVNQLNITKINPTGKPYIEAEPEYINAYGLQNHVWVDRRFEREDSLFSSAQSLLNKYKKPKITYSIDAVDYELIDPYKVEKFEVGKLVRVFDEELGILEDVRLMKKAKSDVSGNPLDVNLEIANRVEDLGTTNADLQRKAKINETYAQGSTNIDSHDYYDNCDPQNPAIIRFYIPNDLVNINTLDLTYEVEEFRAYSRATKGGGAVATSTSSGGGVVSSTSSGGGTTATSTSGGGTSKSTETGGNGTQTSTNGGGHSSSTTVSIPATEIVAASDGDRPREAGGHYHLVRFPTSLWEHNHSFSVPAHSHSVSVPAHSHSFSTPNHSHNVTVPSHTHDITVPNHTHDITLPDHAHAIDYGIYKLQEKPSKVTIKVDGNTLPITSTNGEMIDLIPYLQKETGSGKVARGRWVSIEITPDRLARVNATVIGRLFIQSRVGGTF